jgi:hypothetical protein
MLGHNEDGGSGSPLRWSELPPTRFLAEVAAQKARPPTSPGLARIRARLAGWKTLNLLFYKVKLALVIHGLTIYSAINSAEIASEAEGGGVGFDPVRAMGRLCELLSALLQTARTDPPGRENEEKSTILQPLLVSVCWSTRWWRKAPKRVYASNSSRTRGTDPFFTWATKTRFLPS